MSAFLYPSKELNLPEQQFDLKQSTTTLGRHPTNDVSLLLESVSRYHAKIVHEAGQWTVLDLNSSNGTFVNGERVASSRALNSGDVLTLGRATFTFAVASPAPCAPPLREASSSVSIVGEDQSSSTILSTQLNVESTPLPGSQLSIEGKVDLESLKNANERLVILYRLAETIRSSATREEILPKVMELLFEALPADHGVILLLEPPEATLEPQVVRFRHGSQSQELTISRTIIQKCLDQRVAILSRDAKIDARFDASESIRAHDIRSAICVPLVSKSSILGILFIDTKEDVRAFNEDDLAFVTCFANDLAITLHNLSLAEMNIRNERLAAVGQTIAGLAHNIKNILQLAKGGIELMDTAIARKNSEDVEAFWPIVRKGIDRMQTLTQEMLDYSRPSRPELHEANVNEVIDDTVRSFQKEFVEPGVAIQLALSPEVPMRNIDPDGLYKGLLNLISNAVDALEGCGGTIRIATACKNDVVLIRVQDNGKGIPKEKRARLFQPFFTTKGSKGTGLGLAMTKKYVEDMGATLTFESEEGRGSTFTITIPPPVAPLAFDVDRPTLQSSP